MSIHYRGMTFAENGQHFQALNRLRECLLQLSAIGVLVVRIQTKEGRTLVETATPLKTEAPITENNHGGRLYQRADLYGCQVMWPAPTEQQETDNHD
jgi:hypothetical protein